MDRYLPSPSTFLAYMKYTNKKYNVQFRTSAQHFLKRAKLKMSKRKRFFWTAIERWAKQTFKRSKLLRLLLLWGKLFRDGDCIVHKITECNRTAGFLQHELHKIQKSLLPLKWQPAVLSEDQSHVLQPWQEDTLKAENTAINRLFYKKK